MSRDLKERHPQLMVPCVMTFGVVIYTNGEPFRLPCEAIRKAIIEALPDGHGVGQVTATDHGVYTDESAKPNAGPAPCDRRDKALSLLGEAGNVMGDISYRGGASRRPDDLGISSEDLEKLRALRKRMVEFLGNNKPF